MLYKLDFATFLVRMCAVVIPIFCNSQIPYMYIYIGLFSNFTILTHHYFHYSIITIILLLPKSSRFLSISSLSLQEQFYLIDLSFPLASTFKYVFSSISFFPLHLCSLRPLLGDTNKKFYVFNKAKRFDL